MVPIEDRAEDIWARGVIEQNRRWMLAYLFAFTGDAALAEDLAQETFMIAYRKRDEFRRGESFGAWLRGIARRVALRQREERGVRVIFDTDSAWSAFDRRAAELEQAHVDPRLDPANPYTKATGVPDEVALHPNGLTYFEVQSAGSTGSSGGGSCGALGVEFLLLFLLRGRRR